MTEKWGRLWCHAMRHAPPVAPLVMKFVDIALHLHLHAIHRYSKFSSQYMFNRWQFHQLVLSFLLFECWSFNRGAVAHWKLFGSSGQRLTWWALHTMRSTQQCGAHNRVQHTGEHAHLFVRFIIALLVLRFREVQQFSEPFAVLFGNTTLQN